jgi:hypothetical protein
VWLMTSACEPRRLLHWNIDVTITPTITYDHRTLKTRLPVRSALFKQRTGGLVVRWVTTSEYPLLYVFVVWLETSEHVSPAYPFMFSTYNQVLISHLVPHLVRKLAVLHLWCQ